MPQHNITEADIDSIMEVNKKAIELHSEVAGQNETIIEDLEYKEKILERIEAKIDEILDATKETKVSVKEKLEAKIEEMEKNLFRLIAILTTIGVGTIVAIVRAFLLK